MDNIDRFDSKKSDETNQILKKASKINLEESETDGIDHIENPTKLNMSNIHEPREYDDLVDTYSEL